MDRATLTRALKLEAQRLGFQLAGACPAVTPFGIQHLRNWLSAGYAGEMEYLARREAAYAHPEHVLEGARSVLMLAASYRTSEPAGVEPAQGRISRYAWGQDYHEVLRGRLDQLADYLRGLSPGAMARGVVDTAPLLEGEFAQLAGLGWTGKNTLLLNKGQGSWFFLAALLTDAELEYDEPVESGHCGTCRACLDACPTDAFVAPYVLDSRKCISYLTIELRGQIPQELRPGIGDWLLGCDVCQEVCPWNHRTEADGDPSFTPAEGMNPVDLIGLFDLDDDSFRRRFRHSPLWRPKRRGILRNAAIILGNCPTAAALPALIKGLGDSEPLIRGACAWSLGRFAEDAAREALERRLKVERDGDVSEEICSALHSTDIRSTALH